MPKKEGRVFMVEKGLVFLEGVERTFLITLQKREKEK